MDKKSDAPAMIAAARSTSSGRRLSSVAGVLLKKTSTGSEPSPVAAEPLPASVWPRVDEYLDEPDEVQRWERIGGERKEAFPAREGHGDPHFELDALLKAHLAEGYQGSVDLKTRVSARQEYASDTSLRAVGVDPKTNIRHLEELVFEIVHKRSKEETDERARGFAKRGVRRQIGIFVLEKTVREWSTGLDAWGEPLDLASRLEDPCLAVPLPLAALFDPKLAQKAITRALVAKNDPEIVKVQQESEKQGRTDMLMALLEERGLATPTASERVRATADPDTLKRWLKRAISASSVEDIFDEET